MTTGDCPVRTAHRTGHWWSQTARLRWSGKRASNASSGRCPSLRAGLGSEPPPARSTSHSPPATRSARHCGDSTRSSPCNHRAQRSTFPCSSAGMNRRSNCANRARRRRLPRPTPYRPRADASRPDPTHWSYRDRKHWPWWRSSSRAGRNWFPGCCGATAAPRPAPPRSARCNSGQNPHSSPGCCHP